MKKNEMILSAPPIGPNIRSKLKMIKKEVNGLSLEVRIKNGQIYHTRILAINSYGRERTTCWKLGLESDSYCNSSIVQFNDIKYNSRFDHWIRLNFYVEPPDILL